MAKTISKVKLAGRGRCPMNVLRLAANVADGETFTIGTETYEIDNNAAITAGNIKVDCTAGLTPTLASGPIAAAINANSRQGLLAVVISVNEILVYVKDGNSGPLAPACVETLAGANNQWAAANMYGGLIGDPAAMQMVSRAANAQEVVLGNMHFVFPFTVASAFALVRSTAGVPNYAWVGVITITGTRVVVDNSGATDWVAGDIITVFASQ